MAFTYYAELVDGIGKWQIVCENLETGHRSIVGKNLSQQYAKELAEKLRVADAAHENCTPLPNAHVY
jgi:hypothetical protein